MSIYYGENGKKIAEENYKNGELSGSLINYDENGNKIQGDN
jgi:antitoxin component YwqK of YwqJK toxin-antitoxin module